MRGPDSEPRLSPEISQRFWRARDSRRRVWAVSLSAAIHAIAIVFYALATRGFLIPAAGVTSLTTETVPLEGTRIVQLRQEEPEEEQRPAPPIITPVPDEQAQAIPRQPTQQAGAGEEDEGEPELGEAYAESLRVPETGDPRIWRFVDPTRGELSEAELYQLALAYRLSVWYDSLGAAEEAQRRALDWTFTDDSGGKWGVSPGQIHLGTLTLPLPELFALPSTQRETIGRRVAEWEEINRAARTYEVWESWKDRAQAIRERRDTERADTSGVRRRR
jgi:hypothetical protein